MPVTEKPGRNKISKDALSFYFKKSGGNSYSSQSISQSADAQYVAGEPILYGQAVDFGSDGKLYVSRSAIDGELEARPVRFIAASTGDTDDNIKVRNSGEITIDGAEFSVGSVVWLGSGDINITTDLPDFADGTIIQQLGIALGATKISIDINEPEFVAMT